MAADRGGKREVIVYRKKKIAVEEKNSVAICLCGKKVGVLEETYYFFCTDMGHFQYDKCDIRLNGNKEAESRK